VTEYAKSKWGYRHIILATVWMLYIVNFLDRMSVLTFLPYIQKDLHLSVVQTGWLASIFFFGYACAQFIAGTLADRIGPKKTMTIAIWIFTIVTGLTGFVRTFWQFFVLRLGLALGEGQHLAPAMRMVANWFPRDEKARATGFFSTSWTVAYIVTPIFATQLSAIFFHGAWRPIFFLLCIPGSIGIFCLMKFAHDSPKVMQERGKVSKEEYELITSSTQTTITTSVEEKRYSSKLFLTDAPFYLYSLGMFLYMMINWGLNVWLTTFLVRQHGFNIKAMGFIAAMPFVAAIVANIVGGAAADSKFFRGRARFVTVLSFLFVIPTFLMIGHAAKGQTTLLLAGLLLEGFFFNMPYAVVYSFPAMRYPKEVVGRVIGYSNGFAQFGAFISPLISSYLVIERADKSYYFGNVFIFWTILAVAAMVAFALSKEKPVENASEFELKPVAKLQTVTASAR
jgi:sugar phosphate permease